MILSSIFVKNVSYPSFKIFNLNFKDVWIVVEHENTFLRFWFFPLSLESKLFGVVLIQPLPVGFSFVKISLVLFVFIKEDHLTVSFRSGIIEISLIKEMIGNVQRTLTICLPFLPTAYEISILLIVPENWKGFYLRWSRT